MWYSYTHSHISYNILYCVCMCTYIYIYAHYFHIMKFGRQNNSVSCILMYFGVVECCIPILFLGLHVAQLTQSLLCFTAQAGCWRSPGGLHNSFRQKWPPNRLKELVSSKRKECNIEPYQVRHVLFGFSMVSLGCPGAGSHFPRLACKKHPLDSLQVSSGHSLNEMDWWFHRSPQTKRSTVPAAVFLLFFFVNIPCVLSWRRDGGFEVLKGVFQSSYDWIEISWPDYLSPLLPFFRRLSRLPGSETREGLLRHLWEEMPVAFITVKLPNGTLVLGLRDQWGNSTKSPKHISYGYHMDIIWIWYGYHVDIILISYG